MSRLRTDSQVTVGLYGKLPIFGDFVVRYLRDEFVNPWDRWLQDGLDNSRKLLGNAWLDNYLVAPIWRFVIGQGMLGDGAWIGIMVPSVDRVGRYFPLTLAQPMNPDIDITATYLSNREWFQSIEDLGVDALSQNLNFEEYESRLRKFPAPYSAAVTSMGEITSHEIKKVFLPHTRRQVRGRCGRDSLREFHVDIDREMQMACMWGAECADTHDHFVLVAGALPRGEGFCALLDRNFEAHGWVSAPPHQMLISSC